MVSDVMLPAQLVRIKVEPKYLKSKTWYTSTLEDLTWHRKKKARLLLAARPPSFSATDNSRDSNLARCHVVHWVDANTKLLSCCKFCIYIYTYPVNSKLTTDRGSGIRRRRIILPKKLVSAYRLYRTLNYSLRAGSCK